MDLVQYLEKIKIDIANSKIIIIDIKYNITIKKIIEKKQRLIIFGYKENLNYIKLLMFFRLNSDNYF